MKGLTISDNFSLPRICGFKLGPGPGAGGKKYKRGELCRYLFLGLHRNTNKRVALFLAGSEHWTLVVFRSFDIDVHCTSLFDEKFFLSVKVKYW